MSNVSDSSKQGDGDYILYVAIGFSLVLGSACLLTRYLLKNQEIARSSRRRQQQQGGVIRDEREMIALARDQRELELQHVRVLAILVPAPPVTIHMTAASSDADASIQMDENSKDASAHAPAHHWMYDPEQKRYDWTENVLADATITCSICMEPFGMYTMCIVSMLSFILRFFSY